MDTRLSVLNSWQLFVGGMTTVRESFLITDAGTAVRLTHLIGKYERVSLYAPYSEYDAPVLRLTPPEELDEIQRSFLQEEEEELPDMIELFGLDEED